MEAQKIQATDRGINPEFGNFTSRESSISLEGLDDLLKWASDMVADGEEPRSRRQREQRIRRQVMETVQHVREQQATVRAQQESGYLNRRVIALLQKLQDYTEEISTLRQIIVMQAFSLERIPALTEEVTRLKSLELDIEKAAAERREMLNALSKMKTDRDYLDEIVRVNEEENARLAQTLAIARAELERIKSRKWWQIWKRL